MFFVKFVNRNRKTKFFKFAYLFSIHFFKLTILAFRQASLKETQKS